MPVRDLLSAASGIGAADDPNFKYVSLLLNGDGTNGAQNNTFLDSSTNNFTITRNGNTTQGSFSPYGNLWSNYVSGTYGAANSGPYLKGGTSVSLGTGNFTYEGWFNLSSPSTSSYLFNIGDDGTSSGMTFYNTSATNIRIYGNNATLTNFTVSALSPGVWYHFAFVRNSGVITFYLNGVSQGTYSSSLSLSGNPYIFAEYNGGSYYGAFSGYASNVRLTNTAVYTGTFTPSTTPLTAISGTQFLSCQSNRFIDNSSNNATVTTGGTPQVQRFSPFNPTAPYDTATIGGSAYVPNSSSWLTFTQQTFSGDFTLEGWVYTNQSSDGISIFGSGSPANYSAYVYPVAGTQAAVLYFGSGAGSAGLAISNISDLLPYQWMHCAWVRSSGTVTFYLNGTSRGSKTLTGNYYTNVIGAYDTSAGAGSGYLTDARATASAVYTSNFTPPTSPLGNVSGTAVRCNFTNAGIPDLAMQNDLETVGNAQVSTSVKKYGTGSLSFGGVGNYLKAPAIPSNSLSGSTDFTVEMWCYPTANAPIYDAVMLSRGASSTTGNYSFALIGGGTTPFVSALTGIILQSSTSLSLNTWSHVAFTRTGTTWYVFVNGTQTGTTTSSTTFTDNSGDSMYVGVSSYDQTANRTFTGYIDDIRITKGYARYTTTFTPPTAALPTY